MMLRLVVCNFTINDLTINPSLDNRFPTVDNVNAFRRRLRHLYSFQVIPINVLIVRSRPNNPDGCIYPAEEFGESFEFAARDDRHLPSFGVLRQTAGGILIHTPDDVRSRGLGGTIDVFVALLGAEKEPTAAVEGRKHGRRHDDVGIGESKLEALEL